MKKLIILIVISVMMMGALCGCGNTKSPVDGKKVAYIVNMPSSKIFEDCAAGAKTAAEKLGMRFDSFFSGGDDEIFKTEVTRCAEAGYDGLYLSHGGESYSYKFLTQLLGKFPNLKIVTFDTQLTGNAGTPQKISGVTQFFQDDAGLAESLLSYVCTTLVPDQKPAKILKVWVGGTIAAFDRREIGYQKYIAEGKITTVETVAPSDFANAADSTYQAVKSALQKYTANEIDAVWCAYDVYAQGAYRAIKESGKNISLVSVDLSDTDAALMQEENSVWKASACTDFKANGEQGIRILALQLNNEYGKIVDPITRKESDFIEMPASLLTKENLPTDGQNIYDTAPTSYGNKSYYVTSDWLKKAIGY